MVITSDKWHQYLQSIKSSVTPALVLTAESYTILAASRGYTHLIGVPEASLLMRHLIADFTPLRQNSNNFKQYEDLHIKQYQRFEKGINLFQNTFLGSIITQREAIYDEYGSLVAIYAPIMQVDATINIDWINLLKKRYGIDFIETNQIFTFLPLNNLEELIIAGLVANHSISDIAAMQGVSHSYIKQIIAEKLCAKFEIVSGSSKHLVDKLLANGFYHYMPKQLFLRGSNLVSHLPIGNLDEIDQHILILTLQRFTQEEIAQRLKISRSLVAKKMREIILPEFCVNSVKELLFVLSR